MRGSPSEPPEQVAQDMIVTGRRAGWLALAAGLAALAAGGPAAVAEPNPFLPPQQRQDEIEARLQTRIDKAVSAMEERIAKAVIDSLSGKAENGQLPKALQDALARRADAPPPTPLPPGLPGLPPLPAGGTAEVVPRGAVFVGCLDGKAFFQDRAGSPFLIDPRAFPPSAGGAGACGQ